MTIIKNKVLKFSILCALLFSVTVSNAGIFSAFKSGKIFAAKKPVAKFNYKKFATVIGAVGVGAFIIGSLFFINKWNKANSGNDNFDKSLSEREKKEKLEKEQKELEDRLKIERLKREEIRDQEKAKGDEKFYRDRKETKDWLLKQEEIINTSKEESDAWWKKHNEEKKKLDDKMKANDEKRRLEKEAREKETRERRDREEREARAIREYNSVENMTKLINTENLDESTFWKIVEFLKTNNNAELFKLFIEKNKSNKDRLLTAIKDIACYSKNLEMIKVIIDNLYLFKREVVGLDDWNTFFEGRKDIDSIVKIIASEYSHDTINFSIDKLKLLYESKNEYVTLTRYKVSAEVFKSQTLERLKYLINLKKEKNEKVLFKDIFTNERYLNNEVDLEIVKYLVENGICDVNEEGDFACDNGRARFEFKKIIYYFIYYGELEVVKYLLDHGADINFCDISVKSKDDRFYLTPPKFYIKDLLLFTCNHIKGSFNEQFSSANLSRVIEMIKCLVDHGVNIEEESNWGNEVFLANRIYHAVGEYINECNKKQNNLYKATLDLIDDLENNSKDGVSVKIAAINDMFNKDKEEGKEVPLYAKQTVINSIILFFNEIDKPENILKKDLIKFEDIEQLFKKIEFNYTFLNDDNFKVAVEFAKKKNLVDINKSTVLSAQLVYCDNKKAANIFETEDSIKNCWMDKKKLAENGYSKDVLASLKHLSDSKFNKKRFRDIHNTIYMMENLSNYEITEEHSKQKLSMPGDVVGNIIGFSGIDFGKKYLV